MVELRGAWCGGALGAEAASPTCIAQVYEDVETNVRRCIKRRAPEVLPLPTVKAITFQALRGLAWYPPALTVTLTLTVSLTVTLTLTLTLTLT